MVQENQTRLDQLAEELALEAVKSGYNVRITLEPLIDRRHVTCESNAEMLQQAQQRLFQMLDAMEPDKAPEATDN